MLSSESRPRKGNAASLSIQSLNSDSEGLEAQGLPVSDIISINDQRRSSFEQESKMPDVQELGDDLEETLVDRLDLSKAIVTERGNYFIDPTDRHSLYSKKTAPPLRPTLLFSIVSCFTTEGIEVYKWTPNSRFYSNEERMYINDPKIDTSKLVEAMAQSVESPEITATTLTYPSIGTLGKNDCTGYAEALRVILTEEGVDNSHLDR